MRNISFLAVALVCFSVNAQEVRQANIVSVTPVTDDVQVVKYQCGGQAGYVQQPTGIIGRIVGAVGGAAVGSRIGQGNGRIVGTAGGTVVGYLIGNEIDNAQRAEPNCRAITTLEPTFGGFLVVYELDGNQYSLRMQDFPQGKTIPVKMQPTPIN